ASSRPRRCSAVATCLGGTKVRRNRRYRSQDSSAGRCGRGACEVGRMADIFISYTASDRDWAFWIARELDALGHKSHIHEWEIPGGGDIAAWMEERHHDADHILCVISKTYLSKPYSSWERRAAQWAAANDRPNFALPVFIEACEAPTLLAHVKRCDLHGLTEEEARARLSAFLGPVEKPTGAMPYPGQAKVTTTEAATHEALLFPGRRDAVSNVSAFIGVPPRIASFTGRMEELDALNAI